MNYGNTSYKFGGKRKAAKLITDLFRARQIFRFDTADVLSNGIPESRYCFNNRHSTAWLKNERTGIDDGGPVHANVCVDARPGDVITWRVYWLFWDYAITRQWTVSSPDNPHTHKVLYTTAGAGAIPAGKELPRNIGEDVIIVDP
ncbi:MAG: hypothetical protein ACR2PX_07590 [Endozoicomonas sp.]|uniref:hypothetical protein n=1 Tax=Endozoicomonas sp. TaxID=1892382 RepID=UPI003D9B5B07